MSSIVPILLSGGSGSRLWPSSRSMYPKQFLKLVSDNTLLQDTVLRLDGIDGVLPPVVVANNEHRFFVAEQLIECGVEPSSIILEPVARNTGPAIALAALKVLERADDIMLVLPSDHIIQNVCAFHKAVELALGQCELGKLVTFNIKPDKPETGYGYIKAGDECAEGVFTISEFVEKPNLETAKRYVDSGDYGWNSGIFMFKASVYLNELGKTEPEMVNACKAALAAAKEDLDFIRVDKACFECCLSNSIDYAVMEKTMNGVMVFMEAGWSDVGSWSALWELKDKDSAGNVTEGDVVLKDVSNSFFVSDNKLVVGIGVENIVLVETDDSILLVEKNKAQDVKPIVELLINEKRKETDFHRKVYRPWGYYDSIESGQGFQVKRLVVNPGAELSLQMHYHRAEHWVVVKGTAEVVNGDVTSLLDVNQSTYIPIGVKHKLKNPGKIPLELIEVQSGQYLEEDDIERFEDVYGRVE